MPAAEIRRTFGPRGIQDYAKAYGRRGAITDATQMTLFTAEGLLRGFVREAIADDLAAFPTWTSMEMMMSDLGTLPRVVGQRAERSRQQPLRQ